MNNENGKEEKGKEDINLKLAEPKQGILYWLITHCITSNSGSELREDEADRKHDYNARHQIYRYDSRSDPLKAAVMRVPLRK